MSLTVCIILVPGHNGGAQAPPGSKCRAIPECGRYWRIQQAFAPPGAETSGAPEKENARRGRSRVFEGTTGGEEGRRGSRRSGRSGKLRPPAMLLLVAGRCLLA